MIWTALIVATIVLVVTPAWAQVGTVNPNVPVTITVPPPPGSPPGTKPTTRPSIPFTNEPSQLNNPYPTLPNAGLGYSGQTGIPIAQYWVPPQPVEILLYVPTPPGIPEEWVTQYTEIPGYYVTETTSGFLYPDRWALANPAKGVYQWQRVPAEYRKK
jgi:hypothetical protein